MRVLYQLFFVVSTVFLIFLLIFLYCKKMLILVLISADYTPDFLGDRLCFADFIGGGGDFQCPNEQR